MTMDDDLARQERELRERLAALETHRRHVGRDINPIWYFAIFAVVGFTAAMLFLGVTS